MKRILIVQPYIPAYRTSMFRRLKKDAALKDIEIVLLSGEPSGMTAARGDNFDDSVLDRRLHERSFTLGGKTLHSRSLSKSIFEFEPDGIVVEQAIKNLELYLPLLKNSMSRGPSVAMWGQGRTFSTHQGRPAEAFKNFLTKRSDWFFSYTQEGASYLAGKGFDQTRITTLNNTIDTESLADELAEIDESALADFRRTHGLVPGMTALFMGGVDPQKGVDFLLKTANQLSTRYPGFKLLVAGSGSSVPQVRHARDVGAPVVYLGRLDGAAKAMCLKAADFLMIPQWVGLVAVDSLVSGKPIFTTEHPTHSPEFGYLVNGRNSIVCDHNLENYAAAIGAVMSRPDRLKALQQGASSDAHRYPLSAMVSNFSDGMARWMSHVS